MAKKTTNARLGLIGGISILGTTGIVRPYSTASFKASVVQGIDVARVQGHQELVFTTGGRSEQYAMALLSHLPEEAFIEMGDFVGIAMKRCVRKGLPRAHIVGMVGKLSKMAQGRMMTHAAAAQVDMSLLARIAAEQGASPALEREIHQAATARRVLELCTEAGLDGVPTAICERVVTQATHHVGGGLEINAYLMDFDGNLLGRYPPEKMAQREAS